VTRDWLTFGIFADRVGERFWVTLDDDRRVAVELADATESTEPGGRGPDGEERLQFSLEFRGPAETFMPQGTYPLTHAELGELTLFLVPLGPDADSMRYEAAFA
jgi:hypothetical protein